MKESSNMESKKKCCEGCKKGEPGQNKICKAKLMLEQLANYRKQEQKKEV